ncbi:hypothetical protein OROMI_008611 [Orobanche minor]
MASSTPEEGKGSGGSGKDDDSLQQQEEDIEEGGSGGSGKASSTPEEGKGSCGSGKNDDSLQPQEEGGSGGSGKDDDSHTLQQPQEEDNEEDGGSKDDSSSEDSFFDKLICESDSESDKKDSDVEYDSDVPYEDVIRGDDEHYPITNAILRDDARALFDRLPRTDEGKQLKMFSTVGPQPVQAICSIVTIRLNMIHLILSSRAKRIPDLIAKVQRVLMYRRLPPGGGFHLQADLNMPMGMYISLLHRACMLRKLNCVKALIRGGCNIMAGDGKGPGVPFHLACCGYSLPLIKFMIDDARSKGQDTLAKMLCATNSTGLTPLDYARISPYPYAIKNLLYPPDDPSSSNEAQASLSKKPRTK